MLSCNMSKGCFGIALGLSLSFSGYAVDEVQILAKAKKIDAPTAPRKLVQWETPNQKQGENRGSKNILKILIIGLEELLQPHKIQRVPDGENAANPYDLAKAKQAKAKVKTARMAQTDGLRSRSAEKGKAVISDEPEKAKNGLTYSREKKVNITDVRRLKPGATQFGNAKVEFKQYKAINQFKTLQAHTFLRLDGVAKQIGAKVHVIK